MKLIDWFISFLFNLSKSNSHNYSVAVSSIGIAKKMLQKAIPPECTYKDATELMKSIGYYETYTIKGATFFVDKLKLDLFCNSITQNCTQNCTQENILLDVTYGRDSDQEVKLISWPKTECCQSDGYKAVSVIKTSLYSSGETKKERVFIPSHQLNLYV